MKRAYSRLIAVCGFVLLASSVCAAQDFSKKYELAAGGRINIHSVSGNVTVAGYNGNAVVVTAVKEGRDRDRVEVEDLSSGDSVELRSRYPEHCNCDASINFTVQVPRGVKYKFDKIGSASGNIEIRGVAGDINGRSASGDVTVEEVEGSIAAASASGNVRVTRAVGTVNAHSASGDVEVDLAGIEGAGNMEFTSASGDVRVKAPANLDADVDMSCVSGDLKTDFGIPVTESEHSSHRSARGRLGSGARTLRIRSSSGSVSLLHN
jgi:Putative adhesin